MGAYKPYENELEGKLNNNYQSMMVALDIENISLSSYGINAVEGFFYICKRPPFCRFDYS